jgi:hypothetical protein
MQMNNLFVKKEMKFKAKLKKTFSITILVIFLITNFFSTGIDIVHSDNSIPDYSEYFFGGSGTEADPWQITTCQELQNINYYDEVLDEYPLLDDNFILNNDIDCSETTSWNEDPENPGEYLGFEPLGFFDLMGEGNLISFEGVFDGDNYSINDLYINRTGDFMSLNPGFLVGLFSVSVGEIKNVNLIDADITGYVIVGGLASYIAGGSISNSSVTGEVSSVGNFTEDNLSYTGGLVGALEGVIEESFSNVTVFAVGPGVGGLVGVVFDGEISNSYATGSVTAGEYEGSSMAGGFVGLVNVASIENSYATGDVTADGTRTAGFIGDIQNSNTSIYNSFSTGILIISGQPETNPFINSIEISPTVENSYYYLENNIYQYGTPAPVLESDVSYFYDQNNIPLDEWDFENIWLTRENDYPILAWQGLESNQYTLTYTANSNGTISGTTPQAVSHGESGTEVEAIPNEGYHFVSWSDGVLTAKRTDANVTQNITVSANFEQNEEDQPEEEIKDEEETEKLIKIESIQGFCNYLEVTIKTKNHKKEKLDFKINFKNQRTQSEDTFEFKNQKTDKNGEITITLYPIRQNSSYDIKAKFKDDDEYSDWSKKKEAKTLLCLDTIQEDPISTNQEEENNQDNNNKQEDQDKEDEEDKKEDKDTNSNDKTSKETTQQKNNITTTNETNQEAKGSFQHNTTYKRK